MENPYQRSIEEFDIEDEEEEVLDEIDLGPKYVNPWLESCRENQKEKGKKRSPILKTATRRKTQISTHQLFVKLEQNSILTNCSSKTLNEFLVPFYSLISTHVSDSDPPSPAS